MPPARPCCTGCGPAGGSRTCSSTRPSTTASTPWPTTPWTPARTPAWSRTRPGSRPAKRSPPRRPNSPPPNALPQLLAGPGTPKQMNAKLPGVHRRIEAATRAVEATKTALRPVPAKILATELDPNAKRARPRLARRGLQMVLRLLAFNAYLADPNEYRAIARNLLHLGGHVDYTTQTITVTLDRPDSPRVARALQLLTEELNPTPARLPGDRRPLTYQVAGT